MTNGKFSVKELDHVIDKNKEDNYIWMVAFRGTFYDGKYYSDGIESIIIPKVLVPNKDDVQTWIDDHHEYVIQCFKKKPYNKYQGMVRNPAKDNIRFSRYASIKMMIMSSVDKYIELYNSLYIAE